MIERTSREHALELVAANPEWKVLDLGCGADGIRSATAYADIVDRKESYPDDRFVQTDAHSTPFEDKEFDFVFAIHLAEHTLDPPGFCAELMRIGKRGYIEVPTPFFDNFVLGNSNPLPHGHASWVIFDDVKKQLVFRPRLQIVAESAIPADTTFLLPFFRESMHTEMYWEDTIKFRVDDALYSWTPGNSDSPKVVDLRNKEIPSNIKPWRPRKFT